MKNIILSCRRARSIAGISLFVFLALAGTRVAHADLAAMAPETSTFSFNVRGYVFTAPTDFLITGIHVLPAVGSGNSYMNWAVVRFDGATPPPVFPGVTGAFTQLGVGFDQLDNAFAPVSLTINAGDVIGIYGETAATVGGTGINSYASVGATTTIFGNTVALTRSGMQFQLGSGTSPSGMHDVWEESGFISRVEFTYSAVPEPSTMGLLLLGVGCLARLRLSRQK